VGIRDYKVAAQQIQTLLKRAREGMVPMGFNVVLPSPEIIEIATLFPFEWLSLDLEHTLIQGSRDTAALLRAAEPAGIPMFVKPNSTDPLLIRDAMDAGAHGVLLPFTGSAQHLRDLEQACKFAPQGDRGFCTVARAMNYATEFYRDGTKESEYPKFVNEDMLFIPLIESLDGVENIDEILDVPGFDVFHVGMGDLIFAVAEEGKDFEYMIRLASMLCKKIHDAGKILIGNLDLRIPLGDTAEFAAAYHCHMPYVTDSSLLAYACKQAMQVQKDTQPKIQELLASLKP
jgi:2-keto-3-deoxy-L-rhamnonate aldolase RhmA